MVATYIRCLRLLSTGYEPLAQTSLDSERLHRLCSYQPMHFLAHEGFWGMELSYRMRA